MSKMENFIGGIAFGIWLILGMLSLPGSEISKIDKIKQECERSLPRNQTCKLIAVPNQQKE